MPASNVAFCHLLHLLVLWPPRNFSVVSELSLFCNRTKFKPESTGLQWLSELIRLKELMQKDYNRNQGETPDMRNRKRNFYDCRTYHNHFEKKIYRFHHFPALKHSITSQAIRINFLFLNVVSKVLGNLIPCLLLYTFLLSLYASFTTQLVLFLSLKHAKGQRF